VRPRDNGRVTLRAVPVSHLALDGWQWRLSPLSFELDLFAYAALNKHVTPSFPTTYGYVLE